MIPLNLFDFHCDTPSMLYQDGTSLVSNPHHVSLEGAKAFREYTQVMAIYSPWSLDDENSFRNFHKVADYLMNELENHCDKITYVRTAEGMRNAETFARAFLAVEDARLLAGKRERLRILHARGVRFLTLVWSGESCIGGAHNTDVGLTDFGRTIVEDCFSMGIIPDISHASVKTADEILTMAEACGKPVVATHSNAYAVHPHTRNLRDEQFERLKALGGLAGICLCNEHLSPKPQAAVEDIVKHIEHYMSLGGEDHIAMGSDFDGTDLPEGIGCPSDLMKVAEALAKLNYTDTQLQKLFWQNATQFVEKNLLI